MINLNLTHQSDIKKAIVSDVELKLTLAMLFSTLNSKKQNELITYFVKRLIIYTLLNIQLYSEMSDKARSITEATISLPTDENIKTFMDYFKINVTILADKDKAKLIDKLTKELAFYNISITNEG